MADPITVAAPGQVNGTGNRLEIFLKNFGGEIITAYRRMSKTTGRHMTRSIESGKSAAFPVLGRTKARYLAPGKSLDEGRTNIKSAEETILIDGLLVADAMITDIDDAMSHFEVSGEYSAQLGEALALAADGAVLAEVAKMVAAGTGHLEDASNPTGLGRPTTIALTNTAGSPVVSEAKGLQYMQALLEMQYHFDLNFIPEMDRTAFARPDLAASLVAAKLVINSDYSTNGNIQEGRVLRVSGFDIVCVPGLTQGGADATDILQGDGHVFPSALKDTCVALCIHRSAVGTLTLRNMGLEHARRIEFQGDLVVAKYAIGHKGLRPEACGAITMTLAA
nr:hypothetical protein [uncultured Anaeromusa sp.]